MDMMQVGIVVLAAGGSSRLGSPKQLLAYKGKTLLRHTLEVAMQAKSGTVIAVLGAYAERMQGETDGLQVHVVTNAGWQDGIASSIRCGVDAACATMPHCEAIIIMLCDQPFVNAKLLHKLVASAREADVLIAACSYGNTIGVPALFKQELFCELQQLAGDTGARALMRKYADRLIAVPFAEGDKDIDTEDDYRKLQHD